MIPCTLFFSGEGEFRPYCGSPLPVWGPAGGLRTGFAQSDQQCPWSTSCISWQWCLSLQGIWGNLVYGELPCFSGDWLRSLKQQLSMFAIFQVLSQSYCFLSLLGYLLLNSCFIHLLWSENIMHRAYVLLHFIQLLTNSAWLQFLMLCSIPSVPGLTIPIT